MISDAIAKRLSAQVGVELGSAYIYLAMATFCRSQNFNGAAHWLDLQAKEELSHGLKIVNYLQEQGRDVQYPALSAPQNEFSSLLAVFEKGLKSELDVTAHLQSLAEAAHAEKDFTTFTFLQWFLTEQVEEVSSATQIVEKLKMIGDNPAGLYALDRELASRAGE